jgi:hypothetical protein
MRNFDDRVENSGATAAGRLSADEDNVRFKELENLCTTSGITLDPQAGPDTDLNMIAQAMARYASGGIFGTDGGSANTYVVSASGSFVAPKALFTGMRANFTPANANDGASTLNAFGLGVKALRTIGDTALIGGELGTDPVEVIYSATANSSAGAWLLLPWTSLKRAGAVGNQEYYGTPGTYSFTVPASIFELRAFVLGGAASGSRRQSTTVAGFGGGAAPHVEATFDVTPGETVTVVVGAGGIVNYLAYPGYQPGTDSSVTNAAGHSITSPGTTGLAFSAGQQSGAVRDFFEILGSSGEAPEGTTGPRGGFAQGPLAGAPDRTYASIQPLTAGVGCGGSGAPATTYLAGGGGGDGAVLLQW